MKCLKRSLTDPSQTFIVQRKYLKKISKKIHKNKYFEENDIILKNHHGGLKGKSTATARAVLEHKIEDGHRKNKLVEAAGTDLSAYDKVKHKILLKKLEYYDVKGT